MNAAQRAFLDADRRGRDHVRRLVADNADPDTIADAVAAHLTDMARLRAQLGLTRRAAA